MATHKGRDMTYAVTASFYATGKAKALPPVLMPKPYRDDTKDEIR